MSPQPKTLTYDEWLARAGRKRSEIKCEECDGTGEEMCGECGQMTTCMECDGRGKWDETLLEYEAQRERDLKRWKELQPVAVGAEPPEGAPQP